MHIIYYNDEYKKKKNRKKYLFTFFLELLNQNAKKSTFTSLSTLEVGKFLKKLKKDAVVG